MPKQYAQDLLNATADYVNRQALNEAKPKPAPEEEEETSKPEPTQMQKLAKSTKNAFGGD